MFLIPFLLFVSSIFQTAEARPPATAEEVRALMNEFTPSASSREDGLAEVFQAPVEYQTSPRDLSTAAQLDRAKAWINQARAMRGEPPVSTEPVETLTEQWEKYSRLLTGETLDVLFVQYERPTVRVKRVARNAEPQPTAMTVAGPERLDPNVAPDDLFVETAAWYYRGGRSLNDLPWLVDTLCQYNLAVGEIDTCRGLRQGQIITLPDLATLRCYHASRNGEACLLDADLAQIMLDAGDGHYACFERLVNQNPTIGQDFLVEAVTLMAVDETLVEMFPSICGDVELGFAEKWPVWFYTAHAEVVDLDTWQTTDIDRPDRFTAMPNVQFRLPGPTTE